MNLNTETAYQPAARSSFDEQRTSMDNIQRFSNGKRMWSKPCLITFWVLQLLVCIVGWALGSFYAYGISISESEDGDIALAYVSPYRCLTSCDLQTSQCCQWPLHSMGNYMLRPHCHGNCHVLSTEPEAIVRRHFSHYQDDAMVDPIPDGYPRRGG
jgi:hypothetical protein